MKLLQVGCFAATAVRAQEGSGQDVDYTLDETRGDYEYEYDEFGNKKKKNKKNQASYSPPVYSPPSYNTYNYQDEYYGKVYATDASVAYALNCWPANFDTDKLVYDDTTNKTPYERFDYGPLHYYGSEKKGLTGGTEASSPAAGANNRGGLYHYGWENSASTNTVYKENAAPSGWVHYHSARHAGCLYELAGFDYDSTTYTKIFDAHYYNGYYLTADPHTATAAVANAAISYVPNWVHFFNAHLLAGGDIGKSTAPVATDRYGNAAQSAKRNARVVIANPQYEGLGYLNFISTYRVNGKKTGEDYQEFIDMTEKTNTQTETGTTYNKINAAANGQHTDGIGGEWFFDGWMGTWSFTKTGSTWFSTYTETDADAGTWASDLVAISSFPHNELGKDFRFNLRILQKADAAAEESYYWYKVNTISIDFPKFVSYALHNDYKRDATVGAAANTVLTKANQMMNVVNSEERVNIIPPLDIGTWDDVNFLRNEDWVRENETEGPKYNRINGYLGTATADATAAEWCTGTDAADENYCSKSFKIEGLMNTYDHHFAAQKGNIQEVWIQLSYAIRDNAILAHSTADEDYVVESPFPYLHFHATEIAGIDLACSTTGVFNGNKCDGTALYHPAAASNNHAFGG